MPAASRKDGHGNVIARVGLVSSKSSRGTTSSLYLTLAVEGEAKALVTRSVRSGIFFPSHFPGWLPCGPQAPCGRGQGVVVPPGRLDQGWPPWLAPGSSGSLFT